MTKLTIAIPTYNRPEKMVATIGLLLPQLTAEVEIIVLDNHSTEPLDAALAPLRAQYPDAKIELRRNTTNIGGNANILRCLEVGSGEWIWTLSDDDRPAADAIQQIFAGILAHAKSACINFCTSINPKRQTFETCSLDEFLNRLDSFGNLLFITANVYHRARSQRYLAPALAYSHSCASQVVIFLSALRDQNAVAASNRYIADFVSPTADQGWPFHFFFYFYEIVETLPDIRSQRKLSQIIEANEIDISIFSHLRWAASSEMSYPHEASALLFLSKGAWVRGQYASSIKARLRWWILCRVSGLMHRHFALVVRVWKQVHRLKHGKQLLPMEMDCAFRGHFSPREIRRN